MSDKRNRLVCGPYDYNESLFKADRKALAKNLLNLRVDEVRVTVYPLFMLGNKFPIYMPRAKTAFALEKKNASLLEDAENLAIRFCSVDFIHEQAEHKAELKLDSATAKFSWVRMRIMGE